MIGAVWRGERPLWELFFLWYLVGGAVVVAVCFVIAFFALAAIEPTVLPWLTLYVGPLLTIPYQIMAIVGVVRGAVKAEPPWRQLTLASIFMWFMLGPFMILLAPLAIQW
jgi:hypothetical protein